VINRARDLLAGFESEAAVPQPKPRRRTAESNQRTLFE